MIDFLLIVLLISIPVAVTAATGGNKKRGCGGGCATCGNRETCHRKK